MVRGTTPTPAADDGAGAGDDGTSSAADEGGGKAKGKAKGKDEQPVALKQWKTNTSISIEGNALKWCTFPGKCAVPKGAVPPTERGNLLDLVSRIPFGEQPP